MDPTVGSDNSVQLGRVPNRATFALAFEFSDDGGPLNLSGASARFEFRTDVEASPSLVVTSESDSVSFAALSGQVQVTIPPEEVQTLCGVYVWGLSIRAGTGDVPFVISGDVEFFRPPVEVPSE